MTRKQVARYLGKSIATVRRAEGRHLHPRRDARGVLHFDREEVRALRSAIESGDVRLCANTFRSAGSCPSCSAQAHGESASHADVSELQREIEELRMVGRQAVELLFTVCPGELRRELESEVLGDYRELLARR